MLYRIYSIHTHKQFIFKYILKGLTSVMAKLDFQYVIISFSVCHMILEKYSNMLIWSLIMINYCHLSFVYIMQRLSIIVINAALASFKWLFTYSKYLSSMVIVQT